MISEIDRRYYTRAAEALYPDEPFQEPIAPGQVVATGTDRAEILSCSGGCWAPAWIWIDDATAVKYRLTEK